jgi:hypothetical protein
MQSQIHNNKSDMYNKAHKRFMSTVCAREANAYKQIAKSKWVERYDSFQAENEKLREALHSIEDIASNGSDCDVLSIVEIANKALKEAKGGTE